MVELTYKIDIKDALDEYLQDGDFRELLQTGSFTYIENCFVLDKPEHISHNGENSPSLTNYARLNIEECAFHFEKITYRVIPAVKRGDSNDGGAKVTIESETKFLPNKKWVQSAIKEAERASKSDKTFWEFIEDIFDRNNTNAVDFESRTLLDKTTYSKYMNKNKRPKTVEIPSIVAIAVGYDLTLHETENLMRSFGLGFIPSNREHSVYKFILTLRGWDIHERNKVLDMAKITRLGSHSRDDKKSVATS